jgi:hypothetical protein
MMGELEIAERHDGLAEQRAAAASVLIELEDRLFPRSPTPLDKRAPGLRILGAAALGLLSTALSMLAIYILLTLLFHYQPA